MTKLIPLIFVFLLLNCCKTDLDSSDAYIGGEIINPVTNHVILFDSNNTADTLWLNSSNRFSKRYANLKPGLVSISHGQHVKPFLLEPNDSIMVRVNAIDFDASVVFSGQGAKKNNYFITLLNSISDNFTAVYKLSRQLNPKDFMSKIDSIKLSRFRRFEDFNLKHPTTKLFDKVISATISYSDFTNKELYPDRYYYATKNYNLPQNYYNFRNLINYNESDLVGFHHYTSFLFLHFNNLAKAVCVKSNANDSLPFDRNRVDFHLTKLSLIDSLVSNEQIKNRLLKYSTRNFLAQSTSVEDQKLVLNSFMQKNLNPDDVSYISSFYKTVEGLEPGKLFPNLNVISSVDNTMLSFYEVIQNRPTVACFWSNTNKYHFINSHNKINALREAYPKINFISININESSNIWTRVLNQNNYDKKIEYKFKNPERAKRLLALTSVEKVVVIHKDNTIAKSNIKLNSDELIAIIESLK